MYGPRVAAALLALVIGVSGANALSPAPTAAVAQCGTYTSETVPPPTIRVLRTAGGTVETVNFGAYVKNVLSREWISSWTTESLRSGALAVKHYAWYQVVHWRGYVNGAGECFDVFDSVRDQLYDPSRPTFVEMANAVDATWGTLALRGGRLFPTYYNAGSAGEPCGANANGWQMHQWGTQACGLDGLSAAEIMAVYYSGVTVTDAPPAEPPPPTPSPTPMPTTPPAPSPNPAPPPPTPAPTPSPPPAPGGGQVDLVAPPAPPPADPAPVVVEVMPAAPAVVPPMPTPAPAPPRPGAAVIWLEPRDHGSMALSAAGGIGPLAASLRWMMVGSVVDGLLAKLDGRVRPQDPGNSRRTASSDAATSWMASPTLLKMVMASRSRVAQ